MQKKLIFLVLVLAFVLPLVSSAQCNATNNIINSSSISNSCTLDSSGVYNFVNGVYNINGSNSIILNANNILINFNGSTVFGNSTTDTNSRGISMSSRTNITLTNGILHTFREGMRYTSSNDLKVINMTIYNVRSGVFFITSSNGLNVTQSNLTDNLVAGVYIQASRNSFIEDNYFKNASIFIEKSATISTNLSVQRNTFNTRSFQSGAAGQEKFQIALGNLTNANINNNNFLNSSIGLGAIYFNFVSNILIKGNNISYNDRGIAADSGYGNNITIEDNYINNSYTHEDVYDNPINIVGTRLIGTDKYSNLTIQRNILNNYGCVGITLRDIEKGWIINNTFSQQYSQILPNNFDCSNEPLMGIFIHQWYKGFIPAGTQSTDNYTIASNHSSNNISISGNIFNNINVPLRIQGGYNITHDIQSYWFKSFRDVYLSDKEDWYLSNDFNNASGIRPTSTLTNLLQQGVNNNWNINFTFIKDSYEYYINTNNISHLVELYNHSKSLIYYNNGSVACSDISNCDGNINISLTPNNYSYILDNFNLTEGVIRQFSPLSISGTSTSKTITSQLSQSINATVVVNVPQCSLNAEYKGQNVDPISCSNNIATFNLNEIPAGVSVLNLQPLDINCSSNTGASIIIILVFSALSIVALTFIIVIKFKEGELDVKLLIIVFIAIIVGLVLFTQIAQLTGSVCS